MRARASTSQRSQRLSALTVFAAGESRSAAYLAIAASIPWRRRAAHVLSGEFFASSAERSAAMRGDVLEEPERIQHDLAADGPRDVPRQAAGVLIDKSP